MSDLLVLAPERYQTHMRCQNLIYDALRDLVPSAQFAKSENIHGGVLLLVKLQAATLLKTTHLHGCFSRFLNCTNGTKSRKASHILCTAIETTNRCSASLKLFQKVLNW